MMIVVSMLPSISKMELKSRDDGCEREATTAKVEVENRKAEASS
jgi:hypothetical protein